jgi:hypothetical protein
VSIGITITGDKALSSKLHRYPAALDEELNNTMVQFSVDLLSSAKRHASGRPGPNVVTGAYVANMRVMLVMGREYRQAMVANSSPQARRLEYGFYGTDSLGRVYHQGPFPHMRPALLETASKSLPIFHAIPVKVWGSM